MRVLIACECSGRVREAFRQRGHDAYSCDLKPAEDGSPFHIIARDDDHLIQIIEEGRWDLVISHPPCKYLCSSGLHWTTRGLRDPAETEKAIAFVRRIMEAKNVKRKAIENPTGCISTRIRKYDQKIQPYYFGEDASKGTCLWLESLPLLKMTKFVPPRMVCKCGTVYRYEDENKYGCPKCGPGHAKPRWGNQTDSGQNRLGPSESRSADRARTYPGIADAMAEQWGNEENLKRHDEEMSKNLEKQALLEGFQI